MGRNVEFNIDHALTEATKLFWERGYTNTSLSQILTVMGIGESSFYNKFKSKKNLYLKCLDHYNLVLMEKRVKILNSGKGPEVQIYDFFKNVAVSMTNPSLKGCLFTNSLARDVLAEDEIKDYVFNQLEGVLSHFTNLIEEGVERGEFRSDLNARTSAKVVYSYLAGILRMSVFDYDKKQQLKEINLFLDSVLK